MCLCHGSVDAARVLEVTGERDLIQEKITRLEIEMEGRLKEVVMGKEEEMRGVIRGSEEDQKEEVRKVVEVYEGKIGELERRVRGLEDELRGMNVEKTGLLRDKFEGEGVLRTVRLELEQREKEVEEKSLRYHEVKDKMAVLEDDNKQLVREVTSLSVIANTYETERAKEKEGKEVVARMRSDWEQAKRSLEDNLEMLRQRGEGMGEKVKVASGEIKKGNEIIARLQVSPHTHTHSCADESEDVHAVHDDTRSRERTRCAPPNVLCSLERRPPSNAPSSPLCPPFALPRPLVHTASFAHTAVLVRESTDSSSRS